MLEGYAARLEKGGNKPATINKKLRYLRAAINRAIRRGYAAKNPFDRGLFRAVEDKRPRIVTGEEEVALLDATDKLYGFQMWAFVRVALDTGGRRAEVLGLTWDRITLEDEDGEVCFARTKSHRDRVVPINSDTVEVLRRLQIQTLHAGGPFIGMGDNLGRRWGIILRESGVTGVSIHDLRRTLITRLIRAGVPLPHVQKLAGHADIKTTLQFYNWVSDDDLRAGIKKLQRGVI